VLKCADIACAGRQPQRISSFPLYTRLCLKKLVKMLEQSVFGSDIKKQTAGGGRGARFIRIRFQPLPWHSWHGA